MTFDEKREQVLLAEDIGKLLDGECSTEEHEALLASIREQDEGEQFLQKMAKDNALLQRAVPADVPQGSLDRFETVIDREFEKRGLPTRTHVRRAWTLPVVQIAAALVLIAGTFMLTNFWMQSRLDTAVASLAAHMETERMLLAQSVQEALETKVSGEPVFIGQEGNWSETLTPIKTYKSTSGHWCRQYLRQTTFGGMDLSIKGTACREENGTWTTVFAEPVSDKFSPQSSGI
ncbi:MAG: hypothetical protein K5905_08780 [Roseibium sp.]|uniref:hypothetical protein n=1 Tax=Roseibium sp. TaxID=1936156 RepID=UPI00261E254D|nr:hypothetical protein [Roseibium sp.]MCV0425555.1 hypothetical protein [Roseibium sp.]